jgi:HEAT repeat protein
MRISETPSFRLKRCLLASLLVASLGLSLPSPLYASSFSAEDASGLELIRFLDHEKWKYRSEALEEIEERKLMQAIDKVVEMAKKDMHPKVRLEALEVLEKMDSSWLVPTAEHMVVADPVEDNREEALEIIEDKGGGARSTMVLGEVIAQDKSSDLRESAAELIREKEWKGAEEQLARAALRDGDAGVRRECRRALAVLGGEKYRPVLHRILLDEPNKKYRLEIAELIEDNPLPVDSGPLIDALDDPYSKIARVAARSLVKLGDKSAASILREKALETADRGLAEEFGKAASLLEG